uniref:Uncharacterized protein n=1 Tax=Arundo donax TaxID=35708 RepID=A0A0A9EEJ1_ARUDO
MRKRESMTSCYIHPAFLFISSSLLSSFFLLIFTLGFTVRCCKCSVRKATIARSTPNIAFSISAPLPCGSSSRSALATASIVLMHPLCGSFLTTSSDWNMLSPSTPLSTGRETGIANEDRNGRLAACISLACFHVPSRRRRVGLARAVGGVDRHQEARSEAPGEG